MDITTPCAVLLHAQCNGVHLATRHGTFADLTPQELVAPVYQLVCHRVTVGVAEILVADPSRPPFDDLCARCVPHGDAEVFPWTITTPVVETQCAAMSDCAALWYRLHGVSYATR